MLSEDSKVFLRVVFRPEASGIGVDRDDTLGAVARAGREGITIAINEFVNQFVVDMQHPNMNLTAADIRSNMEEAI